MGCEWRWSPNGSWEHEDHLIVTGQIVAALTIDHFGLLRSLTFPLTPARLVGAVLMAVGVFLALRR